MLRKCWRIVGLLLKGAAIVLMLGLWLVGLLTAGLMIYVLCLGHIGEALAYLVGALICVVLGGYILEFIDPQGRFD